MVKVEEDFASDIKYEHFTSICRLCLRKKFNLIPIFPEEINFVSVDGDYDDKPINEMLEFCFKLKISSTDNLPKSICSSCFNLVKHYNEFYLKCLNAQEILENVANLHEMKLANSWKADANVNMETVLESDKNINNDKNNEEDYSDADNNDNANYDNDSEPWSPIKTENKKIKTKRKTKKTLKLKGVTNKIKSSSKTIKLNLEKNENVFENEQRPVKKIPGSGQCQFCGKMYSNLRGHLRKMHSTRYKCTICNKTRPTLKGLEQHINSHKTSFICDFCGKSYASTRRLKEHRASKHTNETNYSCKQCDAKFAIYSNYRRHLTIHSSVPVEYKCDICNKTFVSDNGLSLHKRIHTGIKPHKCEFCGKGFTRSENLKDHRRVHTKERPYICSHCGSSFTQKSSLNVHTKKFHPISFPS